MLLPARWSRLAGGGLMVLGMRRLSRLRFQHLKQCLDIAEGKGECLLAASIAGDSGDMVGHQHTVVTDIVISADDLDEVYVAEVRPELLSEGHRALARNVSY